MNLTEEFEKAKQEVAIVENKQVQTKTDELLDASIDNILKSDEAKTGASKLGNEQVHSEFERRAVKIEKQNIENKEEHFANKKRQRKLSREEAEEELEHKYKMQEIKKNAEHKQMLDKRKKLVEQYGYLYSSKEMINAVDSEGNIYQVPKDFSYSTTINKIRTFVRNIDKLDVAVKKILKWSFIIGGAIILICVLKHFNILA